MKTQKRLNWGNLRGWVGIADRVITIQLVSAAQGQATHAKILPSVIENRPPVIAANPKIITAGCSGKINGFAIKNNHETWWKCQTLTGSTIACAIRVKNINSDSMEAKTTARF